MFIFIIFLYYILQALTKSLAERQEEYAQARLRILGSAKNEEDDDDDIDR